MFSDLPIKGFFVFLEVDKQRHGHCESLDFLNGDGAEAIILKSRNEGILRKYFLELLFCKRANAASEIIVFGHCPCDEEGNRNVRKIVWPGGHGSFS
jgi:hypothetical protein